MGKRDKRIIRGTAERPRLCVFRSNNEIYAQLIDDTSAHVILACSTIEKEIKNQIKSGATIEASALVGKMIGQRMLEKNLETLVFDRNGKPYHGRIKALADATRSVGIKF
jgi:large subunit ribosomal protein L18